MPLMLAIIGGDPARFAPYVELYHRAYRAIRHARHSRSACIRPAMSPRPTSRPARSCGPTTRQMRDRIGTERGWPPMGRDEFDQEAERGSLYVGSPETVARKIAATAKALGISRFQLKYSGWPLAA